MSNKEPPKKLFQLAVPLLLNSLIGMVTTLLDTMIISAHSKDSAAAVSLANQILAVAYDLSVLLAVGATIMVSHALGQGDSRSARQITSISIYANTLFGILIGIVLFLAADFLVVLLNTPQHLIADAVDYIKIIAFAIPFNGFLMASIACLRGFSQMRVILVLGLVVFPSYLLLNYVLVLGFASIPALGPQGSALATLLVRVGSVIVLVGLLRKVLSVDWRLTEIVDEALVKVRQLAKLSTPSVLDNVAYGFYQLVLVSFVAGYGVVAIVSRLYTLSLSAFLAILVMAISQANEVILGYRHGAGDRKKITSIALSSAGWSAAIATLMSILMYIFSEPLIRMFGDDPEIISLTQQLLFLVIFIQPLTGTNTVLFHSLRVIGDVRQPVIFSQLVMWVIAMPLAYWFSVVGNHGVLGLWYAMIVEELLKTLFMLWRWHQLRHQGSMNSARQKLA
ncbi:MAG: MATE family efflux transporter [Pseudomonadales bacterium]|nr:MATE family efflux transporter [Pseudomonadales bacterium]